MESKSFAARVGVSVGTVTNWERGRTSPHAKPKAKIIDALQKLCEVHGIWFTPEGYPVPKDCFRANEVCFTPDRYPTPESFKLNDNYTEGE